jgi:hypothetical protein
MTDPSVLRAALYEGFATATHLLNASVGVVRCCKRLRQSMSAGARAELLNLYPHTSSSASTSKHCYLDISDCIFRIDVQDMVIELHLMQS